MKIGLIGFGSIGERHYKNLLSLGHDVAVLSSRGDIKISGQMKDWRQFRRNSPYDAIFITNETSKHLSALKKCPSLNPKAIFVEKPLAGNTRGLDEVLKSLKKRGISVWIGYNFHFFRPFLKIKESLKKIGRIYYMRVFAGQDLRAWRKRDYRLGYSGKRSGGGGVLLDLVHDINYPGWLIGDRLIPVSGVVKKLSRLKIDVEDYAESVFVSEKKKILVSVHQDYLRNSARRSLEIAGEKGDILWDLDSDKTDRNDMYLSEIRFFLDSVRKGGYFSNWDEAVKDLQNIEWLKKHGK